MLPTYEVSMTESREKCWDLEYIRIYTSSARTSRGQKFPKGKELYSTERICL